MDILFSRGDVPETLDEDEVGGPGVEKAEFFDVEFLMSDGGGRWQAVGVCAADEGRIEGQGGTLPGDVIP